MTATMYDNNSPAVWRWLSVGLVVSVVLAVAAAVGFWWMAAKDEVPPGLSESGPGDASTVGHGGGELLPLEVVDEWLAVGGVADASH
jgi:hypothetical protein